MATATQVQNFIKIVGAAALKEAQERKAAAEERYEKAKKK